ncbi:MAG: transketolase [Spirochaetales bacterium]|nr:transketolase [Spirochaetales bacterium]
MVDSSLSFEQRVAELEKITAIVRRKIVDMVYKAQSGHIGGALSASEIVTALYFGVLNIKTSDPRWQDRDRFVLSKGHACPVWYSNLALRGFFDEAELDTLRQFESILQGHPVMNKTPGVDMTTGSLGQGLSFGLGMALEARMINSPANVWVVLGDGEIQEGQVWEAAGAAAAFNLENLVAIVDDNGLQMDGYTRDIYPHYNIAAKFQAFGWETIEIDGHDMSKVLSALEKARDMKVGKPVCIVAKTVKGKGVSFMEDVRVWHGKAPNEEEYKKAMAELQGEVE